MPSQDSARIRQAKIAALVRSSQEPSGAAMTAKARRTFADSFYERTDPGLPEAERRRQADAAYRAHMRQIAQRPRSGRSISAAEATDLVAAAREQLLEDLRPVLAGIVREVLAATLRPRADAV